MTTLSVAAILAEAARRRPEHTALIEGEQRIGFARLWHQVRAQAAALAGLGVRPGDRVALLAPNTAEFPRAYYAILAAGAVVVPVHLLLTAGEADSFAPQAWMETVAAAAASPSARVEVLPGSHNNLFTHPEEVAALVTAAGLPTAP